MQENKIDYEDGLTTTQLNWMKDVQAEAFNAGVENTFIFTHAPIVGGGGLKASYRTENRIEFVNWANNVGVRGVFAGHTHQHHIFYDVTVENMDKPQDIYEFQNIKLSTSIIIYYNDYTYYDPPNGIVNSPAYIESASFKF